jgi:hypothetical protein
LSHLKIPEVQNCLPRLVVSRGQVDIGTTLKWLEFTRDTCVRAVSLSSLFVLGLRRKRGRGRTPSMQNWIATVTGYMGLLPVSENPKPPISIWIDDFLTFTHL